jgi:glycosyltransferase involved in cell wall biosynthesis
MKPRVLFVARDTFRLPLGAGLGRKWDALAERLDLRVLAAGTGSDPRFHLRTPTALDGPRFYASLPTRIARELKEFHPDVVVAQSPFEGFAAELGRRAAGSDAKIVVEVHGDWRASTRLYGSRLRPLAAPLGDRVAGYAVRHADAHRAISGYTASLVRQEGHDPAAVFPTYSDIVAFSGPRAPVPDEPRAIFVGVLERYKNVELLAEAWRMAAARVPGARLHIVGTGTQVAIAEALRRDGAEWDGTLEPPDVAAAIDRARVLLLPSMSEGLGRVVIEAFARGRGVIGTRVGGIPDLVEDGVNGLLVEPADAAALAASIERVLTDHSFAVSLGEAAAESASQWTSSPEEFADRMLALVDGVVGPGHTTPKVLWVARDTFQLPLGPGLARKWDALSERLELRVLAGGTGADPRFRLRTPTALDGPRFYASLPGRIAHELKEFRPDIVVAQSPFEGFAAELGRRTARSDTKIVVEVHGDWRASTRHYGSRLRPLAAPFGDRAARYAMRHADAHRAISGYTASLVRETGHEPAAVFPTYSDLVAFSGPLVRVPEEPRAIFVGALERYKNIELLAEAWRMVAARVPGAHLHVVGTGSQAPVVEALRREGAEWDQRLEPPEVAAAVDRARVLLLPSMSEGLGRVVIEAFARGRAVIGTRAGGIPDIVEDGVNGLLIKPDDPSSLAGAIERVLSDYEFAEQLGQHAAESAPSWVSTADEYADQVVALVDGMLEK